MSDIKPTQADTDAAIELLKHIVAKNDAPSDFNAVLMAIATARAEGRAEERRDVVAWLAAVESHDKTWIGKLVESGDHIGTAKEGGADE